MRVIIAGVLAGVAAVAKALDPNWSFESTTTISDKDTTWYTVSVPFLTTVTTDVSGKIKTITKTEVSISMGTDAPSALLLHVLSTDATVSEPVHEFHDLVVRSVSTATDELVTHTHSDTQANTINDSDVLPTIAPTSDTSSPAVSFSFSSTTLAVGATATSSETSLTTHSSPLGYGGGEGTSSTTTVAEGTTTTVTVTAFLTPTTTSSINSPTPSTLTFVVTYGSPVQTLTLSATIGASDTLAATESATSPTSNAPSMSTLTSLPASPSTTSPHSETSITSTAPSTTSSLTRNGSMTTRGETSSTSTLVSSSTGQMFSSTTSLTTESSGPPGAYGDEGSSSTVLTTSKSTCTPLPMICEIGGSNCHSQTGCVSPPTQGPSTLRKAKRNTRITVLA
ncbi:hypothetical protein F4823DRAFT_637439 [Ustulina deusta]|nr:hypothetical protein F4823DRAFT_637439 [Ustulina deusta]